MSKITNVEISHIETSEDFMVVYMTNKSNMVLAHNYPSEVAELVFDDIRRMIEYRNKHRNRVRKYYNEKLRKKK